VAVVIAGLLFALLVPTVLATIGGFQQYANVRAEASDAVGHLRTIEALLAPERKQLSLPDDNTLQALRSELLAAHADFAHLSIDLGRGVLGIGAHVAIVNRPLDAATALVAAGDEVSLAGLDGIAAVQTVSRYLKGGLFADGSADVLDAQTLDQLRTSFESAAAHLSSAVASLRGVDLGALPSSLVKPGELAELRHLLATWPQARTQLADVDAWLHVAPVILGAQTPKNYLLELMDRSELRPTGGFIGNYAVMTVQQGRIQPFTLRDVYLLDLPYAEAQGWPSAPPAYHWWPWSGYALRDSNLSANFPTTARLGMHLLMAEGGPDTQGVIAITPAAIASVIAIVGPIAVPEYNETVTAGNLEALIHLYQETTAYWAGRDLPASDQLSSARKRFTALLGQALLARLHGLTATQLVAIAKAAGASLHTKDIQIYMSDSETETLLSRHAIDGAIVQGPSDAVTIVDANISANKANLFTSARYADQVQLDANGTATHQLAISYDFAAADPSQAYLLFGRYYYTTYLRIYTPPGAELKHVDGFLPGTAALDASDEPGRQMWGGEVTVQEGVPYTLHFTWSVAHAAVRDAAGHWHYTLEYQHQAGSSQTLHVTIAGAGRATVTFSGALTTDQIYEVK
jgi:hypothetical protein